MGTDSRPGRQVWGQRRVLEKFADGTSNSILLAEAATEVPWTKPEDIPMATATVDRFGGRYPNGFLVTRADGLTKIVRSNVSAAALRAALTRAGAETFGPDW